MIVNEDVGQQNTTNITSCVSYADYANETLKIDCNTTTTGADLFVGDDMQVVGDVWFKDLEGEYHIAADLADHYDGTTANLVYDDVEISFETVGGTLYLNITSVTGEIIQGNIRGNNFDGTSAMGVALTEGTDLVPADNYVYLYNDTNTLTLATAASYPSIGHIDIARVGVGSVDGTVGNITYYNPTTWKNWKNIYKDYERLGDSGTLYIEGFNATATSTTLNMDTGKYWSILSEIENTNNLALTDGFYFVNSSGEYQYGTDLTAFTEYSDGTAFTGNQRMNVVWGVVAENDTFVRLVAVPQSYAGTTYSNDVAAERDNFDATNYFPSDINVKKTFVPLVRTIVRADDVFRQFETGEYLRFLGGQVSSGGSAPSSTASLWTQDGDNIYYNTGDVNTTGNISVGQKITFAFGEVIDNVIDGWLNITGSLFVGGKINATDFCINGGTCLSSLSGTAWEVDNGVIQQVNTSNSVNITGDFYLNGTKFEAMGGSRYVQYVYPTSNFTTSSGAWTDVTDWNLTIPTDGQYRIFITAQVEIDGDDGGGVSARMGNVRLTNNNVQITGTRRWISNYDATVGNAIGVPVSNRNYCRF